MKKFAFVINVFREASHFHSGGEKLFYELVKKAVSEGHEVDLFCTTYLGDIGELRESLNKVHFIGHPKDFKCPNKIESFYKQVKTEISKNAYDYVISENISPVIDIGILQGHSQVHYKEMADNIFSKILYKIKKAKFISAQKKWLSEPYRKIIVPSATLKSEISYNFGIHSDSFAVIYPGVDKPAVENEISQNDIFTFGLSAPSFEKKGGYIFLKALKRLKKSGYDFKARIIYPKFKNNFALQSYIKLLGLKKHVEFLPYQEKMDEFYNSVDCLVMPSLLETFGLVALEAMVNKKPAIVSSCSGASEIIDDFYNGFVFEVKDKSDKALAYKMAYILDYRDKYNEIAENAYKTALKYDWQNFCDSFMNELLLINSDAEQEKV